MAYTSNSAVNGDYGSDSNETGVSSIYEANLQGQDLTRTRGMPIQCFYDPLSYDTPVYTTQIDYVDFTPPRDRTNLPGMTKLISR